MSQQQTTPVAARSSHPQTCGPPAAASRGHTRHPHSSSTDSRGCRASETRRPGRAGAAASVAGAGTGRAPTRSSPG